MKNKKTNWKICFPIIGLLVLIWMAESGQYLQNFDTYNMAWLYGFVETTIMAFVMMIIPFICRLVNKSKFEYKRGNELCYKNSIIAIILLMIIDIILLGGIYDIVFQNLGGNIIYGIIFYYINKWLHVYKSDETKNNSAIDSQKHDSSKKSILNLKLYIY